MGVEIIRNLRTNKFSELTVTITGNDVTYTISTTLTSHPGVARNWIHSTLHQYRTHRDRLVIGLGVQWTPYNHYYHHHSAATIQLCIGNQCLIFHLAHADSSPRILRRILSDPRITFVGLWNSLDASKLKESRHELEMVKEMPIDARYHVEDDYGRVMRSSTIAEIAEEVLEVDIERSEEVSRSDWEVEDLSLEQIQQAVVDAFISYVVGIRISAWEFNPFF